MFDFGKMIKEAVETQLPKIIADFDKRKKREYVAGRILTEQSKVTRGAGDVVTEAEVHKFAKEYDDAVALANSVVK